MEKTLRGSLLVTAALGFGCTAGSSLDLSSIEQAVGSPSIVRFDAVLSDTNLITLTWKVTNGSPSNQVYIYESVGYRDQSCASGPPNGCSTSFRVPSAGVYRYVLSVDNGTATATATAEVVVAASLTPPTVPSPVVGVDMFDVQPQTLSWSHAGSGYVKVRRPGQFFPVPTTFLPIDTYQVQVADLQRGRNTFTLTYCEEPAPGELAFCSEGTPVTYAVRPARFDGVHREVIDSGQPVTLNWSGPGTAWYVSAPSLGVAQWVQSPMYTFTASQLTEGIHQISLTSCIFAPQGNTCSNKENLLASASGTVQYTAGWGELLIDPALLDPNTPVPPGISEVGTLDLDAGGSEVILTPRTGRFYWQLPSGSHVEQDEYFGHIISADKDYHEIVVGSAESVPTWEMRPWDQDFTACVFEVGDRRAIGWPLDVLFDDLGDIWVVGEFSHGLGHVQSGVLTHYEAPFARVFNQSTGLLERVKPFTAFGGTTYSSSPQRVIEVDGTIWYPTDGDLHARLMRFDPTAADLPETRHDERFCAIHVPTDWPQVYGVAWDGQRIWIAEGRPMDPQGRGALGWLDPAEFTGDCDNLLDYSDPAAVEAAKTANRCASPTDTACIHEVVLPTEANHPLQILWDPDGYIWFSSGYLTQGPLVDAALGRYEIATGEVDVFPLPAHHNTSDFSDYLQSFPWQLRADSSAVYLGEYSDVDLVRFDKNHPDPTECEALIDGKNPCMSELYVPKTWESEGRGMGVSVHSVALRNGRLWFTLTNESQGPDDPNASTFGFVDVASWASGTPTGVLYTGLSSLGTPRSDAHHAFRGIEVSATGEVVLADQKYVEVVVLSPL